MAFKKLKQFLRKRKLSRCGIKVDVDIPTAVYGDRSGCWTVAPEFLLPQSIVYSVGVGNNIAWDLAMIDRHHVDIYAFDPTPRSVAWIGSQALPSRFKFHPIGLSDQDGQMAFAVPKREGKFNYRASAFSTETQTVLCEVKTLSTLRKLVGHVEIDVLKLDIEGAEMLVLRELDDLKPLPGQLLVEFHYHYPGISFDAFVQVVTALRSAGYRIFHISERGYEFSLIHERLLSNSAQISENVA